MATRSSARIKANRNASESIDVVNRTVRDKSMEHEPSVELTRNVQQTCAKKRPRSSRGRSETERNPLSATSTKGKTNKKLKKDDRESIARSLQELNLVVLTDEVTSQLKVQHGERSLIKLVDLLCVNEVLFKELLECHRSMFIHLYLETGKKKDAFLNFQIKWNNHCSVMLLEEKYRITEIDLDPQLSTSLEFVRTKWLDFCKYSGFPVPVSNPVMIILSSSIYNVLTAHISCKESEGGGAPVVMSMDGDDVYYRFGGAALCEMLHLRYQHIKTAPLSKKDSISQEITILQAINSKDKSAIPNYLKYRDLGFMYFPHPTFIPLLRDVDSTLKEVVNPSGLEKHGSDLIKV